MGKRSILFPYKALPEFALWLIPSTFIFQKYLGIPGVVVYIVLATLLYLILTRYRNVVANFLQRITNRQALWLAVLAFLLLGLVFFAAYPIANAGTVGGGSDGDDALNLAVSNLLRGQYPYYGKTYLDNPISPLPGAVFLAAPFVMLGSSAYQNLFWLVLFFVFMRTYLKSARRALVLLGALLVFSPIILYLLVTGNDYLANSIYVLVFLLGLVMVVSRDGPGGWKPFLFAVLLGIGFSSRANFLLLLPLVPAALRTVSGWNVAWRYTGIVCLSCAIVTLPFWVYDPAGFSPLHTLYKLGRLERILPMARWIIPGVTAMLAVVLGFRSITRGQFELERDCVIVLALPVLGGMVLNSVRLGRIDFSFAAFGAFYLFFCGTLVWRVLAANSDLDLTLSG